MELWEAEKVELDYIIIFEDMVVLWSQSIE